MKSLLAELNMRYFNSANRQIIEGMNGLAKNVKGVLYANESYFKPLTDLTCVIVIGHSLGEVNKPYAFVCFLASDSHSFQNDNQKSYYH